MPTKKERIQRSRKKEALLLFADLLSDDQRAEAGLIDLSETNDAKAEALMKGKYADDFDIVSLMADAEDPDTGLVRDLKIDDRDLKSAKNFWDFSYNILGKDAKPPWMIQMWIGVMLFAEYCPCCSDSRWTDLAYVVEKVGKSTSSEVLPNHMQLLDNGVCPKCERHKHELIKKYGLKNYQELVNVLGQRSGKSSSAAAGYSPYIVHRYLKFPRLATMTNSMQNSTELTGTFVSLTFSKAASVLWTPFVNVIDASRWFCLAEGTQISLSDGTTRPIEQMTPGVQVKTFEGSQPTLQVFNNGVQECFDVTLSSGQVLPGTAKHQVQCLAPDGVSLAWKTIGDLTEDDFVVVE